jgi:hypothetical protein
MKLVAPIFVNSEFLGVAGGCGYLLEDGEVDSFMVNKTIGIDDGKLRDLSADIPAMTMQEAKALTQFIQQEVDQIIKANV